MRIVKYIWLMLVFSSLISCKALKKNCDCPNFSDKKINSKKTESILT